jgi:hypothetical protein
MKGKAEAMGYAEVYRRRNAPWRKALRIALYCFVLGSLLLLSLQLLGTQSGLMMGGPLGK